MKIIGLLISCMALSLASLSAHADEVFPIAHVICSPSNELMTLMAIPVDDGAGAGPSRTLLQDWDTGNKDAAFDVTASEAKPMTCLLRKNFIIGLKIEYHPRDRGMCGASPESYLNVTLNGKQILHAIFTAACANRMLSSITIYPSRMQVCMYKESAGRAPWSEDSLPEWSCRALDLPN